MPQPTWRGDFPSRIPSLLRGCRVDEDSQRRYAPWVVRYAQVLALRARHVDVADIARMVRVSRQVVYRYLSLDGPPSCKRHATRRRTLLDPYKEYLLSRWDDGCRNATQLWREIQALSFAYSYTNVSRFLAQYRPPIGQRPSIHRRCPAAERPIAPRHVAFLLIPRPSDLTSEVRAYIDRLCQSDVVIRRGLRARAGFRRDAT